MALIACPECEQQASDRAVACPHCGFPIAEEIERALAEVSGVSRVRSARQIHAAGKLQSWSERYGARHEGPGVLGPDAGFFERHRRLILGVVVTLLVTLQLFFLFSAAYN